MQDVVEMERVTQDDLRQDVGSRKDHRNGTYLRRPLTSLGQIDVAMPSTWRCRGAEGRADVIGRYQRRSQRSTR